MFLKHSPTKHGKQLPNAMGSEFPRSPSKEVFRANVNIEANVVMFASKDFSKNTIFAP